MNLERNQAITTDKPKVLLLGTFHFNFPNLDVVQTASDDKIDVLLPVYQKEIEMIIEKLLKFKPTKIAIEKPPAMQSKVDSMYQQYLSGDYQLDRSEIDQIGFRLAKVMDIQKLFCVDEMGNFTENINNILKDQASDEYKSFYEYFSIKTAIWKESNVDTPIFKTNGILAELIRLNSEERVKKSLGYYISVLFKYEQNPNDFIGVDFETGRWFNRNLKIFRNIQRIETVSSDRILVIYGAEHLNLLNFLFGYSPEYLLVRANDFLEG